MTKKKKKRLVQCQLLILSIGFKNVIQLSFAPSFPCCLGGTVGGNDDISHQR